MQERRQWKLTTKSATITQNFKKDLTFALQNLDLHTKLDSLNAQEDPEKVCQNLRYLTYN
eukprot:10786599-Ditylum_brightwellii.AAC.1